MRKIYSFASCGVLAAAAMTVASVNAANVDQTVLTKDNVSIEYWNDFKDDVNNPNELNKLYPNWRVSVKDNDKFGQGTKGTVNYVYKYADGTMIKDGAVNGTIGSDLTYHNYLDLGVLPQDGEVTVMLTLTLIPEGSADPTIVVFDPYTFQYTKIAENPDVPKATLTWSVENGYDTSKLIYKIETENIPAEGTTYRVWLDAPGNVLQGEAFDKEGTITVKVPTDLDGQGQTHPVTYWVKATVTLADGTKVNVKGNDTGIDFQSDKSLQVGVEGIEAENAPVQYFNLQGVRVAEPAAGIYIRIQGKKATKVVID